MRPTDDQTVLVTGATDGIGEEIARQLAALGARVIVHGRSAERAEEARERTGAAEVAVADLASFAQVRRMVEQVKAPDRSGLKTIEIDNLTVRSGEIVGIAGISGNGQKELSELLAGQRPTDAGRITVNGEDYGATRPETRKNNVRFIPEEPLQNACAPKMTVSENLALRTFDLKEDGKDAIWLNSGKMKKRATTLIADFKVKTASSSSPISALSGGNVQRAVLARELTGEVDLVLVSHPSFGLDFSAVAEIRARIMRARNSGTAVLLLSEDLDELLEMSDRIMVISEGKLVYETPARSADIGVIGAHMAGHH